MYHFWSNIFVLETAVTGYFGTVSSPFGIKITTAQKIAKAYGFRRKLLFTEKRVHWLRFISFIDIYRVRGGFGLLWTVIRHLEIKLRALKTLLQSSFGRIVVYVYVTLFMRQQQIWKLLLYSVPVWKGNILLV